MYILQKRRSKKDDIPKPQQSKVGMQKVIRRFFYWRKHFFEIENICAQGESVQKILSYTTVCL